MARRHGAAAAVVALLAAGCAPTGRPEPAATAAPAPWVSRALPEARGDLKTLPDGRRVQVRYPGWAQTDFSAYRTYAYDDVRLAPAVAKAPLPAAKGDPAQGRKLFVDRRKGPCTGCHLIPGDDVWPAGNVGPDLSTYGDRRLPDEFVFTAIYDPRNFFPNTTMPPWGAVDVLTPEEVVHLVAFLQSLKGPPPPERDPNRDPNTREKPRGFGDNLDPTNNPAVIRAEGALDLWGRKGPAGKACADCHAGGPERSMRGVAAAYPKHVPAYGRVMSVEDFLAVHGPERTGIEFPAQSDANLDMAVLIRMQSNGMPVRLDVSSPVARAALDRGRATFNRKVGQRNHSCADCHTKGSGRGADRFLGGRLLGDVESGLTRHFPTWRTSQGQVWDIRKRFQWCMTPLGMNMLPADAVEYAELELYLASFDNGKEISVPGIRH